MDEIDYNNLGAIEDLQKPTHFDLGSIGAASPLPDEYETKYEGEIYHQRLTPSCGAHAGAYIKNIQEGRTHSPAYLWKRIKQIDGFKPEDGTSMEAIFRALQKYGVCSIDLMANDTTQNLSEYTDPSVIKPAMDEDARRSQIGAYGFIWNPTFEQIKRAIYDYKAIIIRIEISADWWTPSWKGKDILPLRTKYKGQGGHFIVGTGFTKDTIKGLNEWGVTWGDDGRFYFKEDYMGRVTCIGTCFDATEKVSYAFTRILRSGMTGTDVGLLQLVLREKGYFPKSQSVTKFFGAITRAAVMKFQKENGLISDGIFGPKSASKLNSLFE